MNDRGNESFPPSKASHLSIYETLPINWNLTNTLAKKVNALKGVPISRTDFLEIKPAKGETTVVPIIASIVANANNPSVDILTPSPADIYAIKPWLGRVSRFIGRFSNRWAKNFDEYCGVAGQIKLEAIGGQIAEVAKTFSRIPSPRQQFINEIKNIYDEMQKPAHYYQADKAASIEERIYHLLTNLLNYDGKTSYHGGWFNPSRFPLLTTITPLITTRLKGIDTDELGKISIAAAEMMQGLENFLHQSGVADIKNPPAATGFDIFNPDTYGRGLAELFASDKLEQVKIELPSILTLIAQVLPESGPDFANKIYSLAEKILQKKKEGLPNEEIVNQLFQK